MRVFGISPGASRKLCEKDRGVTVSRQRVGRPRHVSAGGARSLALRRSPALIGPSRLAPFLLSAGAVFKAWEAERRDEHVGDSG